MESILEAAYRSNRSDVLAGQRHSHSGCYELIQSWSDGGWFMMKEQLYPLSSGTVYLVNAVDVHCSIPVEGSYIRSKLVVSSTYLDDLAANAGAQELMEPLFHRNGGTILPAEGAEQEMDKLFRICCQCADSALPRDRLLLSASLLQILYLAAGETGETCPPSAPKPVADAMAYIGRHLSEPLTLDDLCAHIHVSKYYLCHAFQATTQMTVMQYLLRRRISIAKKKLLYTDMPLSEIAMTSGFSSFSYFSRIFHQTTGMPPRAFRAAAKNGQST